MCMYTSYTRIRNMNTHDSFPYEDDNDCIGTPRAKILSRNLGQQATLQSNISLSRSEALR